MIMFHTPKNEITPTSILIKGCAYLDLLDPQPDFITLEAVAAGLEEQRFCNQTTRPITVAEHLLRCGRIARALGYPIQAQVACLMHDAAEAFVRDIPGPLKRHVRVVVDGVSLTYAQVEHQILRAICEALIGDEQLRTDVLELLDEGGGIVKRIDVIALRLEALKWVPGSEDWAALDDIDARAWMVADVPESASWSNCIYALLDGVAHSHGFRDMDPHVREGMLRLGLGL